MTSAPGGLCCPKAAKPPAQRAVIRCYGRVRLSGRRLAQKAAGVDPADALVSYTYDPAGNPVRIADAGGLAGGGDVQCFTYDHHRRVVDAWAQASGGCAVDAGSAAVGGVAPFGQSYSYDLAGNRTVLVDHDGGATTTYGYPVAGQDGPHALTSATVSGPDGVSVTSFGYDDAGNTTAVSGPEGVTSFGWDVEGRMVSADTGGGVSEFVYAADGGRLIRRDPDATTLYVFGSEVRLDHATQAVSGTRYYSFDGAVLAMRQGADDIHTLGADVWGTPTIAIDNVAHTAAVRRQDPFGNPRGTLPSLWPGQRGFHTGTHDSATGLVHMGARQYDPTIGRFLSVDPLIDHADSQQVHGYAYANNNPLAYTDPSGLMITECGGGCDTGGGNGRRAYYDTSGKRHMLGTKPTSPGPKPPPRPVKKNPPMSTKVVDQARPGAPTAEQQRLIDSFNCGPFGCQTKAQFCQQSPIACGLLHGGSEVGREMEAAARWLGQQAGVVPRDADCHVYQQQVMCLETRIGVVDPSGLRGALKATNNVRKIDASWGGTTKYRHGGEMTAIEHINYRHAYNSGFSNVSRYSQGTSARQIQGYVDEALRTGKVTDRGVIADLGRTIGTDRAGNPVTGIEVIVRNGNIKTAYPVGAP